MENIQADLFEVNKFVSTSFLSPRGLALFGDLVPMEPENEIVLVEHQNKNEKNINVNISESANSIQPLCKENTEVQQAQPPISINLTSGNMGEQAEIPPREKHSNVYLTIL